MAAKQSETRFKRFKRSWHSWRFRCVAIGIALLPFFIFEISLRILGIGDVNEALDPFIAINHPVSLFEINAEQTQYQTVVSRKRYFQKASFAKTKTDDTFRIFCLGGSTVQGRPFAVETSFTSWLKLQLEVADPTRKWEVVNCGGISYASYRLLPILTEVMNYEPDLVVIYTGHNEFLEDRTYAHLRDPARWQSISQQAVRNIRTIHLAREMWHKITGDSVSTQKASLAAEVETILDHRAGLESYQRDRTWQANVIEHFKSNIHKMIEICDSKRVPLYLCNPASNIRDCLPFKSAPTSGLDQATIRAIQQTKSVHRLMQLDPHNAATLYQAGLLLLDNGAGVAARDVLLRAKDEDICPLRILTVMNEFLVSVPSSQALQVIDVQEYFAEQSPVQIPGDNLFLDHVHPTIRGHQLIAGYLFERMVAQAIIKPSVDFAAQRNNRFRHHLASLSEVYYQQGEIRLKGLQMWTRGQAGRVDLLIEENIQQNQKTKNSEETQAP
ncbi:MAG: hypothetical protein HN617_00375 [Planctomycetaceae bacterium]|jgi:hypothetical protein|nr:hypothetical protein [Planctomycetaceae bacterium]MBT4726024.1 hypothetical protein [Planctomycetaceae bacterium]MBT4847209.1 hypothetical protein [Planctomycetaceae bacterium]MBT5124149.1 hypothetical protein [Planctomycetaceae bacterium]MBT5599280.1 hypothetical protein [Planctomycetaceae bacterium]